MTSSSKHPKITSYMKHLLEEYESFKGKPNNAAEKPFWDIVVITASDTAQKDAYELQIAEKRRLQELPLDVSIHVVSDPPGTRIGNGGSTLNCLQFLHQNYGDVMYLQKILLIHAGGWSQRLPSAAVLGKIFSILPHGNSPFQMLDLKLALYWPFVERIQPGIFLVCADDFLVFDLNTDRKWSFPEKGFTALAHPAPLEVGKSHGVFVLSDPAGMNSAEPVELCECLKVLQKPSESRMKAEGAPLKGNAFSFGDGIHLEGDVIYTDSCFYFGTDVMKRLLNLISSVGTLSCEIDAYGDFLQAVGKNATNDYINLTSNVSQLTPNLLEMRQKVFETLNGSDIHVLVLNSSKFMHIGTTSELLHYFCHNDEFQHLFQMRKDVLNLWMSGDMESHHGLSDNACIIHSFLAKNCIIKSNSVVEFCSFEVPVRVLNDCIVSNCQLLSQESDLSEYVVPSQTFIHTVPIQKRNGKTEHVTIFFCLDDNLKRSVSLEDFGSLHFLGSNVDSFLCQRGISVEDILPANKVKNGDESTPTSGDNEGRKAKPSFQKVSLWSLKLFKPQPSMSKSFEDALGILNALDCPSKKPKVSQELYSMADLLDVKDITVMLNYRRCLYDKIIGQL